MQGACQDPFAFKFHWINEQGNAAGMFRKLGRFDGETLTLEKTEIPAAAIVQSVVRDNRIVLGIHTNDAQRPVARLSFQPASEEVTSTLKQRLDVARSRTWASQHRESLQGKGTEDTYRDAVCPACGATVILSGMPNSPQLYCQFCDSLTTIDPAAQPVKDEHTFKLCDECGMYSKPRKFTVFYFYSLLVVSGWWSKATWRCPGCMRMEAWKMFLGNAPFLLGVPVAITQLVRCYGSDAVNGPFKGLDAGNLLAKKGDLVGALRLYQGILDRIRCSAGVKYNLGMALLTQGDSQRAAEAFELALEDCSNYVPAYQRLKSLYLALGQADQLAELERLWALGEEDERDETSIIEAEIA
ncbi:MAG: tetratricopeptide repeat protein [Patescibacteria group bacterium]|nr:tetratricopeptide repeat protein [Patescibacteria group bacterium]